MPNCAYCGDRIIVGGIREGERRYCNARCQANGQVASVANAIPDQAVNDAVIRVHLGACPKCGGAGPVDIHRSYRVWSAIILTSFGTRVHLCCRSCGLKAQAGDALYSAVLGWWGIPIGLIMTPVQIGRNLHAMISAPDPAAPSAELTKTLRMEFASRGMTEAQRKATERPPAEFPSI